MHTVAGNGYRLRKYGEPEGVRREGCTTRLNDTAKRTYTLVSACVLVYRRIDRRTRSVRKLSVGFDRYRSNRRPILYVFPRSRVPA